MRLRGVLFSLAVLATSVAVPARATEYEKKKSVCELLLSPNLPTSPKLTFLTIDQIQSRLSEVLRTVETLSKAPEREPVSLTPGSIDDLAQLAVTLQVPKRVNPFDYTLQVEAGYARLSAITQNLTAPQNDVLGISVDISLWPGANSKVRLKDLRLATDPRGLLSIAGITALSSYLFANGNVGAGVGLLGLTVLPSVVQIAMMVAQEPNPTFLPNTQLNPILVDEGHYLSKGEIRYLGLGRTANHANDVPAFDMMDYLGSYRSSTEAGRDYQRWLLNGGQTTRIAKYLVQNVLTPLEAEYGADHVNVEVLLEKTGFQSMRMTLIAMRRNLPL